MIGWFHAKKGDNNNNILQNALVTVDGTSFSANTDATGAYNITNVPIGSYSMTASLNGYSNQTKTGNLVVQGQTTYVDFSLVQLGRFVGRVIDFFTLAPINGATVNALQNGTVIGSTTTDSTGNYIISLLPGSYDVSASATGYITQTSTNRPIFGGSDTVVNFYLFVG